MRRVSDFLIYDLLIFYRIYPDFMAILYNISPVFSCRLTCVSKFHLCMFLCWGSIMGTFEHFLIIHAIKCFPEVDKAKDRRLFIDLDLSDMILGVRFSSSHTTTKSKLVILTSFSHFFYIPLFGIFNKILWAWLKKLINSTSWHFLTFVVLIRELK